ncbi:MAG: acyl-CoA dehydrogenase family protein [Cellvibrio sp.]|uniref:acyl-CoA dehydrogenase family protein n=1 Tax=Cellvibrio sp. TaxID=1965322 RepID=UPI002725CD40|nr:acyl-CoA dehydrogenase family protein [Cellvibrio sp.]
MNQFLSGKYPVPAFWKFGGAEQLRAHINKTFDRFLLPAALATTQCNYHQLIAELHSEQLSGLRYSKEKGGTGAGLAAQAMFAESLGQIPSGSIGMALTIHLDMVAPFIDQYGSPEQIERFLMPALRGDILLSHAVSEPGAGSDVTNLATTATRDGAGWRISGHKTMISLASLADVHFVIARLADYRAPFNMVNFLIPKDTPGLRLGDVWPALGNAQCPITDVFFDDLWIGDDCRLGMPGMGMINQLQQFAQERVLSSLRANQVTYQCLARAAQWTSKLDKQLQILIAEWQASRALTYKAMQCWLANGEYLSLSSSSKFISSRLARRASLFTLDLARQHSSDDIKNLQTCVGDARLFSISTGSDEMMLKSIASAEKY